MKLKTAAMIGLTTVASVFGVKPADAQGNSDVKDDTTLVVKKSAKEAVDACKNTSNITDSIAGKKTLEDYNIDISGLDQKNKTWMKIDSVKQAIIDYSDALSSFHRTEPIKLTNEDVTYLRLILQKIDLHIGSFPNRGLERNLEYSARDLLGITVCDASKEAVTTAKKYMKPQTAKGGECLKLVKHVLAMNGDVSPAFLSFASAYQTIDYFKNCDNFCMRQTEWKDTDKYPEGSIGVCQRGYNAVNGHIWISHKEDNANVKQYIEGDTIINFTQAIQLSDIRYGYNSDGHRGRNGRYKTPYNVLRNEDKVSLYTAWRELMNASFQETKQQHIINQDDINGGLKYFSKITFNNYLKQVKF